jgi:hypothetical protein
MSIPYGSDSVVIHGILSKLTTGDVVQICQVNDEDSMLEGVDSVPVTKEVPVEIQQLLHQYADIFADKVSYPPTRTCNHSIPLVPGARPVVVRPYRYAPALKDEIEAQVAEMLSAGMIQYNHSSFSSPVILVKKKDGSYRFCIDYRHLNAITAKGQFPVPVIDELLDELNQAH